MLAAATPAVQAVDYGAEIKNQPTVNYKQVFTDVSSNYWAFEYISEMNVRGVLSGYPNGYFYPENYVTRAEFAKIMTVASSLPLDYNGYNAYADVSQNDWFYPYVLTAQYYLCGYSINGGTYYLPNTNALREDIAVALIKLKGYDTTGYDESILKAMFTDWQSISEYARPYVATALEKGLISGYEDNTFRGQNSITRAEAATLLWRAYQYGSGNKVTASMTPYVPAATQTPAPTATPVPVEKPVVVEEPTPEPTKAPTPKPTEKPTPEPTATPEPEKTYGWKIDTIADISDYNKFAIDRDNNIIVYNTHEYKKLNPSGEVLESCDTSQWKGKDIPEGIADTVPKADKSSVEYTIIECLPDTDGNIWLKLKIHSNTVNAYIDEWYSPISDIILSSDDISLWDNLDLKYSPDDMYRISISSTTCLNVLEKYDLHTCEWQVIEMDNDVYASSWMDNGFLYMTKTGYYIMDYNGDSTLIAELTDIDILDNKALTTFTIGTADYTKGIYTKSGDLKSLRVITPND